MLFADPGISMVCLCITAAVVMLEENRPSVEADVDVSALCCRTAFCPVTAVVMLEENRLSVEADAEASKADVSTLGCKVLLCVTTGAVMFEENLSVEAAAVMSLAGWKMVRSAVTEELKFEALCAVPDAVMHEENLSSAEDDVSTADCCEPMESVTGVSMSVENTFSPETDAQRSTPGCKTVSPFFVKSVPEEQTLSGKPDVISATAAAAADGAEGLTVSECGGDGGVCGGMCSGVTVQSSEVMSFPLALSLDFCLSVNT